MFLCVIPVFADRFLALFMAHSELNVIILLIQQHRDKANKRPDTSPQLTLHETLIASAWSRKQTEKVSSTELGELAARPSRRNKLTFICIYWHFPTFCFSPECLCGFVSVCAYLGY